MDSQTYSYVSTQGPGVRWMCLVGLLVFGVLVPCPSRAFGEETELEPSQKAKGLEDAIEKGVTFLLNNQHEDGSWGSPRRTKGLNIYAPVPQAHHAFKAAVTSLCVSALVELRSQDQKVQKAIDRGEVWLLEKLPKVRRISPDVLYNVWTHAYGIQAMIKLLDRAHGDQKRQMKLREVVEGQIKLLERFESVDGGWGYYDFRYQTKKPSASSSSFTTATVLVALWEAKAKGFDIADGLVERALKSINRQRKPDSSYLYGEHLKWVPMYGINRPTGSLGRSQACNLALRVWSDEGITDQVLKVWLNRLVAREGWLDMGRKRPVPHESWDGVAGYFYYYGMYYAGLTLDCVSEKDRGPVQQKLAEILIHRQEKDGSWWDFPLYDYHPYWGTSFALMTLVRCRAHQGSEK